MGGSRSGTGSGANPASAKIEDVAQTAHQTGDRIADKAASQVDRLSGTAHRAVNSAADVASSAAEWASAIPEQAKHAMADDRTTPERPRVDGWFGEFVEHSCTAPFLMEYPHNLFPAMMSILPLPPTGT